MRMKIEIEHPSGSTESLPWDDPDEPIIFGRAQTADVRGYLPDPMQLISRRHFTLQRSGGVIRLTVLSQASGVTLAGSELPPGGEAPVQAGDMIQLGDFRITMQLADSMAVPMPMPTGRFPTVDPNSWEAMPEAAPSPAIAPFIDIPSESGVPLPPSHWANFGPPPEPSPPTPPPPDPNVPIWSVPAHEPEPTPLAVVDLSPAVSQNPADLPPGWSDWLGVSAAPQIAQASQPAVPTAPPIIEPAPAAQIFAPGPVASQPVEHASTPPAPSVNTTLAAGMSTTDSAAALLRGLGISHEELSCHDAAAWERLGLGIRELLQGLQTLMNARTSFKRELRTAQRTILVQHDNNPFKASLTVDALIRQLLTPSAGKTYMTTDLAIRTSIEDLQAHNLALVTACRATVEGVLMDFSPEQLRSVISPGKSKFPQFFDNARFWEGYCSFYQKQSGCMADWVEQTFEHHFLPTYTASTANTLDTHRQARPLHEGNIPEISPPTPEPKNTP